MMRLKSSGLMMFQDVLWLFFSVVSGLVQAGSASVTEVLLTALTALGFMVAFYFWDNKLIPG
jgi:CPA2 family monovalent cation:H+ antiporter-2